MTTEKEILGKDDYYYWESDSDAELTSTFGTDYTTKTTIRILTTTKKNNSNYKWLYFLFIVIPLIATVVGLYSVFFEFYKK
jgi:hypothetical protein